MRHVSYDEVGWTMPRRYVTRTVFVGPIELEWTWRLIPPLRVRWYWGYWRAD